MNSILILLLISLGIFIIHKIKSKFKVPKIGAMALFSGGVKCGKSTLAVATAISEYKRRVRRIKFRNFFCKLFNKPLFELPLLYSNIPLSVPYVPITEDLLTRKKRFVYGSVAYVCEASLVADSQLFKDNDLNEQLLLFNKLIGHETKGGCIIYDTQCIADCHYSIKRCLSEYIYVHHLTKWLPFFLVAHVQECRYSDDKTTLSVSDDDAEVKLRRVIIPKKTWKYFDCYCYSVLTDHLEEEKEEYCASDLKAHQIVSFKKSRLKGGVVSEKKNS